MLIAAYRADPGSASIDWDAVFDPAKVDNKCHLTGHWRENCPLAGGKIFCGACNKSRTTLQRTV